MDEQVTGHAYRGETRDRFQMNIVNKSTVYSSCRGVLVKWIHHQIVDHKVRGSSPAMSLMSFCKELICICHIEMLEHRNGSWGNNCGAPGVSSLTDMSTIQEPTIIIIIYYFPWLRTSNLFF